MSAFHSCRRKVSKNGQEYTDLIRSVRLSGANHAPTLPPNSGKCDTDLSRLDHLIGKLRYFRRQASKDQSRVLIALTLRSHYLSFALRFI